MSDHASRRVVHTDGAPKAIGPYSQAIAIGDLVFASGQIGLDPTTGELVAGGVEEQTRQALKNLRRVLEAAGSEIARIVKTTVFLADMQDFAAMNRVYGEMIGAEPPARSTVAVKALPKGALVEIEAMALPAQASRP